MAIQDPRFSPGPVFSTLLSPFRIVLLAQGQEIEIDRKRVQSQSGC